MSKNANLSVSSENNSSSAACGTFLKISNFAAKKKLELYYNDIDNEEIKCILCCDETSFRRVAETTVKITSYGAANAS